MGNENETTINLGIKNDKAEEEGKKIGRDFGKGMTEGVEETFKMPDAKYTSPGNDAREASNGSGSLKEGLKDYLKDEDNQKKLITKGVKQAETAISTSLKKGFGIVEDIYGRLKAASPLLQTIESLFNLAMTLFFMPLGNKLAEVLIPATIDLLDKVVDMWDAFEGKTFGEMLGIAVNQGVKLFASYFNNIGELLKEQGGYAASIGTLLSTIGDFIMNHGASTLKFILTATTTILSNFKWFISAWMSMKAAEITLSAMSNVEKATIGKVARVAALAGLIAFAGSASVMTGLGLAEGGYVPAKAGGSLRVLGEGGKGEYVIPEDKIGSYGGNITYNIYGYTDSELKTIIQDTVNEQVSQSRIRGTFRWRESGMRNSSTTFRTRAGRVRSRVF